MKMETSAGKVHVEHLSDKNHHRSHIITVLQWALKSTLWKFPLKNKQASSLKHHTLLHSNLVLAALISKVKLEQTQATLLSIISTYIKLGLRGAENLVANSSQWKRNPPRGSDRIPAVGGALPVSVTAVATGEEFRC